MVVCHVKGSSRGFEMKKDRYLSHSIALCSAAVMMFVFFPSLVERQICSSSSVDKQHEKMLPLIHI